MTRTLVRRLATAGGALGIALAVAAGPAAASAAPAPASKVTAVVHADDDHDKAPCPHRGLLGDVIVDVVHIVGDLLGGLL
ncbi:hypothetical protein [Actinospica sp.]|jgi:hypothetical protein|uniref:hypothetical protein n=1 Tax=Actinospica sp. TaxID=1872142 RepID=UPI002CBD37A7|nr:hypothetical protein [Actinospica sp.]HWG26948.1 hypothetical protein [Actinospica sp.]